MRRALIAAGLILAVAGVGTASASFMITSVHQIAPSVRAGLGGINETVGVRSKEIQVCFDGGCPASAVGYAYCPSGTFVTGGGFYEAANGPFSSTTGASSPVHTKQGYGWGVLLADVGHTNGGFYVEVICGAHRSGAASDAGATAPVSLSRIQASLRRSLRH